MLLNHTAMRPALTSYDTPVVIREDPLRYQEIKAAFEQILAIAGPIAWPKECVVDMYGCADSLWLMFYDTPGEPLLVTL